MGPHSQSSPTYLSSGAVQPPAGVTRFCPGNGMRQDSKDTQPPAHPGLASHLVGAGLDYDPIFVRSLPWSYYYPLVPLHLSTPPSISVYPFSVPSIVVSPCLDDAADDQDRDQCRNGIE